MDGANGRQRRSEACPTSARQPWTVSVPRPSNPAFAIKPHGSVISRRWPVAAGAVRAAGDGLGPTDAPPDPHGARVFACSPPKPGPRCWARQTTSSSRMFDLSGKTALVTGASGGIGGAIARALHAQGGVHVVLSGTREAALDALACDLGDRVSTVVCDLSDGAAVDSLVSRSEAAAGGDLSILVANAGMTPRWPAVAHEGRRLVERSARQLGKLFPGSPDRSCAA